MLQREGILECELAASCFSPWGLPQAGVTWPLGQCCVEVQAGSRRVAASEPVSPGLCPVTCPVTCHVSDDLRMSHRNMHRYSSCLGGGDPMKWAKTVG